MKHLFYTLFCFCLCILFSSCKNSPIEINQTKQNTPFPYSATTISIKDALKHLERHTPTTKSRIISHDDITTIYKNDICPNTRTLSPNNNTPIAYIVNFQDKGFALLGADPRVDPVVMIAPEGRLTADSLIEDMTKVNQGDNYSTHEYFNALAANYLLSQTEKPIEDIQPIIVGPTSDWYIIQNLSPFMKTHWNQLRDPYTNYCPIIENAIFQPSHYPAGCGAIAVAQILAYNHWKYNAGFTEFPGAFEDPEYTLNFPHTPNWTLLDIAAAQKNCYALPADIQDEVARFVFATAVNIGTTYVVKKTEDGRDIHSGNTVIDYVEIFMKKLSSYKDIRIVGYHDPFKNPPVENDSDLIFWEELEKVVYHCHYPILMCGYQADYSPGHFWVVDGWVKEAQDLSYGARRIRTYVYCNFGYGQDDYYCTTGLFGTGEDDDPNYCKDLSFLYYNLNL